MVVVNEQTLVFLNHMILTLFNPIKCVIVSHCNVAYNEIIKQS